MQIFAYILAQNDNGIGGTLVWLIPIAVWVIGSILATLQKKKDEERRRRTREQIAPPPMPSPAPPPAHVPPPILRRIPEPSTRQPQQPRPQPVTKRSPKRYKQPQVRQMPPPLAPPSRRRAAAHEPITVLEVESEGPQTPSPIETRATDSTSNRPVPTSGAAVIRKLLAPGTLRSQFILTELLQPPLGLRNRQEL